MAACPDLSFVASLCGLPLGKETIPVCIDEIVYYTKKASDDKTRMVHSLASSILAMAGATMTDVRTALEYKPVARTIAMHSASLISNSEIPRTPSRGNQRIKQEGLQRTTSGGNQRIKQEGLQRTTSELELEPPTSPGSAFSTDTATSTSSSDVTERTSSLTLDPGWHWSDKKALELTPSGTGN
jgi:hypothetical protein